MDINKFQKEAKKQQSNIDLEQAKLKEISKGKVYEQIMFWLLICVCAIIFVFAGLHAVWQYKSLQLVLLIIAIIYGIIKAINYRQNQKR